VKLAAWLASGPLPMNEPYRLSSSSFGSVGRAWSFVVSAFAQGSLLNFSS